MFSLRNCDNFDFLLFPLYLQHLSIYNNVPFLNSIFLHNLYILFIHLIYMHQQISNQVIKFTPQSKSEHNRFYQIIMRQSQFNQFTSEKITINTPTFMQNYPDLIKSIEQINSEALCIYKQNLLIPIANIQFPNLKHLTISNNQIESIQWIASVRWPCLTEITLNRNHITTARSLIKISQNCSSNLTKLSLYKNQITEISSLCSRGGFTSLSCFFISFNEFVDLRSIFVLFVQASKSLQQLAINHCRLPQSEIKRIIMLIDKNWLNLIN